MPEGTVDVIPVDLVVAADHRAVAALGPEQAPPIVQVASGSAQPAAATARLVDLVHGLVHRAPALRQRGPADRRARVVVPRPGPGAGPAQPGQDGARARPRRCSQSLPLRGKQAEWSRHASRSSRTEVERALELRRALRRLRRVRGDLRRRPPARAVATRSTTTTRRRSASTRASSTGTDYVTEVHLPSVVEHARVRTTPGKTHGPRRARAGCARRCSSPDRHLAAFDLENTLIASNVVESYSWLATRRLAADDRLRFVAAHAGARRPACWRSTARTAATSCATSTAATRARRSTQLDEDAAELLQRR